MTRALGIDFGDHGIKVAEIEYSSKKRQIVGLYEVILKQGQQPEEALREFLANNSIKAERITVGINQSRILLRNFTLPFRDKKKVQMAIEGEWMDILPFELDDYFQETRHMSKGPGRLHKFLSGICPRNIIEEINKRCEVAMIQPNNVLLDGEALANLALSQRLPGSQNSPAYAVVDFGYETTKVAILRGSFLGKREKGIEPEILEVRHLDKGSREWVEWVAEKRRVSVDEAHSWLIHRAVIEGSKDKKKENESIREDLSDDIKSAFRPILVELYQTLQHARVETGHGPEKLFLAGNMSHVAGLEAFMQAELRIDVQRWPLDEGFKIKSSVASTDQQQSFASALALANSYAMNQGKTWLNFKRSTSPNKNFLSETLALYTDTAMRPAFSLLAIALVLTWAYGFFGTMLLDKQKEAIETDLAGEFRVLDRAKGARANNFVRDPERAREIYEDIAKTKQPKDLASIDVGPIAQVQIIEEFSEASQADFIVKEFEIVEADNNWKILAQLVQPEKGNASAFESATENYKSRLEGLGYQSVSVTGSGNRRSLSATWVKPASRGAAR